MSQRVFICYARVDQSFALPLAEQLKARGVAVWIDKWDARPGDDWDRDIDLGLRDCSHLLIVLSPASVDSREVRGELRTILDLGKPVLPVLYKRCEIPRQLRVVQFVDFTGRSPRDASALNELLQALSPLVQEERDSPLGSAAPMSTPPDRAPKSLPRSVPSPQKARSLLSGRKGHAAVKAGLKIAAALLLAIAAWYGLEMFTTDRRMVRDAALSPNGAYLATSSYGDNGAVRLWDVASGGVAKLIHIEGAVTGVSWSPDGKKLALGSGNGVISVYDTSTWNRSAELKGPRELIWFIRWSPDSAAIATGDSSGSLWVWNLAGGALRFTKPIHAGRAGAVTWAPDGTVLATGGSDHSVAVVNARDGALIKRLQGHESTVTQVSYSPDSQFLASVSLAAPYVIVWDKDGKRHDLSGPSGESARVEWSSDGRYFASIDRDNLVYVWEQARFELVRRITLAGSSVSARSLEWSPDGKRIAAGDAKGVQIIDPRSDVPVGTFPDPTDDSYHNVEIAGWSADGRRIGTFTTFERTAGVWDVATASRLQSFSVGLWRAMTE